MIRAVIFDCFGVLYGGSLTLLASMAPDDRREEVYDINSQKDYGYISYDEYLVATAEAVGKTPEEVETIINTKHVRNTDLAQYVKQLKQQGTYKTALLSNMGEKTYEALFPDGRDMFDEVLLSFEEGIAKPNPEIFHMMADRLGLKPEECVMIDDLATNCEGAEIAGMASIQHITNQSTEETLQKLL